MTFNVPRQLGKYTVLEKIGHGAMGDVYKARDEVLKRSVAVKTIAGATAFTDGELLRLFRREAQAAAGLNHPNIVTVFDFGEDDGRLFLVMELLEGADLFHLMRARRFETVRDKVTLMIRIAGGVAYAHSQGFVHRDLKPANIRVLPDGTPKILDFGLARAREAEATRTGRAVGTPHYMAPEQIRNEPVDARADVFSLGALFYELLSGKRPFPASNLHGILFQVLQREPEPVRTWLPELPPVFDQILARALAKEPADRYADAGQLAAALEALDPQALEEPSGTEPAAEAPTVAMSTENRLPGSGPAGSGPAGSGPAGSGAATAQLTGPPVRVVFHQEDGGDRELWLKDRRKSLLDLSLENGIPHYHECGGRARCSSCRIRVTSGLENLQPRTATEERLARRLGWTDDVRLACQTRVHGEVEVKRLVQDTQDLGLLLPGPAKALAPRELALAVVAFELVDFEELAAELPPYDQLHALNRFFLHIGEAVIASGGRIESYSAAGFRALFGLDGGSAKEKCHAAARAAVRAVARMAGYSAYTAKVYSTHFQLGVGLDFTRVVVGRLGHPSKTDIAALGPAARLATRLGPALRRNAASILATEGFVNVVEDELRLGRVLADERVDQDVHTLYEVLDLENAGASFLVQKTFDLCEGRTDEMSEIFYELLFSLSPEVEKLFAGTDMKVQRRMLMETLGAAIRGLDDMESLAPVLRSLGERHASYGVELYHYDLVEQVLIETVQRMIGEELTGEARLAWTKVYNVIVRHMTESAEASATEAA